MKRRDSIKLQNILPNKRLSTLAIVFFIFAITGIFLDFEWIAYAIIPSWLLFLICVWRFAITTKRKWLLWIAGIANVIIILEIVRYIFYFEMYSPSPLGIYAGFLLGGIINIVSAIKIRKEKIVAVSDENSVSQRNDVILWIILVLAFLIFVWLQPK